MNSLQNSTPIRPLHVETDGIARYRQAHSVEDLAAFLMGEKGASRKRPGFLPSWGGDLDGRHAPYGIRSVRGFVEAAHVSRMHVLATDMEETKADVRLVTKASPMRKTTFL